MNFFTFHTDSLAAKVIKFLKSNPEEELSSDDVSVKFGGLATACYTKLGPAVDSGALKRRCLADTTFIYSLGPAADKVLFEGDSLPAPAASPARSASTGGRPFHLDVKAVAIEDDVPIRSKQRASTDWPALFDRMKPQQSCLLPAKCRASLAKAVSERHWSTRERYTIRTVDQDNVRLWRTDDAPAEVTA